MSLLNVSPEVQTIVVRNATPPTNFRISRVCTTISPLALDALWTCIPDLGPLLGLIDDKHWKVVRGKWTLRKKDLSPDQLATFVKYAWRVKHIRSKYWLDHCRRCGRAIDLNCLKIILKVLQAPILPRLRTAVFQLSDKSYSDLATALLGPSIIEARLDMDGSVQSWKLPSYPPLELFSALKKQCPLLSRLGILWSGPDWIPPELDGLPNLLENGSIKAVDLSTESCPYVESILLPRAGSMIRELRIHVNEEVVAKLGDHPLPQLEHLWVTYDDDHIQLLAQFVSRIAPPSLKKVKIQSLTTYTASSFDEMLAEIANVLPIRLQELSFLEEKDDCDTETVSSQCFKYLMAFSKLRSLRVGLQLRFKEQHLLLEYTTSYWKDLEVLQVRNEDGQGTGFRRERFGAFFGDSCLELPYVTPPCPFSVC